MNQEAVFAQKVSTATVGNIASLGEPGGQDQSIRCLMHTLSFLSCFLSSLFFSKSVFKLQYHWSITLDDLDVYHILFLLLGTRP